MRKLLTSVFVWCALLISVGVAQVAATPYVDCSGKAANSSVCQDGGAGGGNPLTGDDGLILQVANFIAIVAGIAAVIMIILAGLRYIQAGGSAEDIAGARRTIIYAIVGLVVISLGRALVQLALSTL